MGKGSHHHCSYLHFLGSYKTVQLTLTSSFSKWISYTARYIGLFELLCFSLVYHDPLLNHLGSVKNLYRWGAIIKGGLFTAAVADYYFNNCTVFADHCTVFADHCTVFSIQYT